MKRGSGWRVILPYALVCAATQVLWLTYAVITTESARHYGVSVSAVGWLAEIFPLLYVVLAIPAGILLDRWFRPVLAGGGALVALGGLLRLGGDTFAWAMAGQVTVAVAQPVVLSAVSKLAGEYLPVEQRAAGISVGSAGGFVGMVLAVLAPAVDARGAERGFMRCAVLVSGVGCIALGTMPWIGARAAVIVAMGLVMLPALPVILTATERLAGPAAGTAGAIVWMAGNLGGLVVALIVQALVHHPLAAFIAMAVVSFMGLPLVARVVTLPPRDELAGETPAPLVAGRSAC
jgi:hypothetical protein